MTFAKIYYGCQILLLISVSIVTGCSKSGDKSDQLISGVWAKAIVDKSPQTNPAGRVLYAARLNCEIDDRYFFGSTGSLIIQRGNIKCADNETDGNIAFYRSDDQDSIKIGAVDFKLIGIKSNQLKYIAALPGVSSHNWFVFLFDDVSK